MYKFKHFLPLIILCFIAELSYANIDPNRVNTKPNSSTQVSNREDCLPSTRQIDMEINNVRARLLTGGDVWWDLQEGRYIVPKPPEGEPGVSSIFAGGVWIGGTDPSGNLKLAGVTYRRSNSNDFYSGPLDPTDGTTDKSICENWDRFFQVSGDNIRRITKLYDAAVALGQEFPADSLTDDVRFWPGKGNPYFLEKFEFDLPNTGQGLGAFWDEDQDGLYDPAMGDFPIIDIRGCEPDRRKAAQELVPDDMIFWIYNDAGGIHSETQGAKINMEVQVQSFAYATNDEINDMTFQRYKLINRATTDIQDCYFAMWVDPDLGCYFDDYVGCDVERSMAYVYNEDVLDGETGCTCPEGVNTYCDDVPILGVDYFRGPLSPKIFNEFGELVTPPLGYAGEIDSFLEEGMTSFGYMNNGGIGTPPDATTDPAIAQQYYNYLLGLWRDGTPVTRGASGYNVGSVDTVKYVFPDAPDNGNGWSMCTADLPFGDRRTLQATGPLLLQPGAVNELIIGAVWVPSIAYPCPDITPLQNADDLAQALFDNCFDIPDGPDAPDVCLIELDREVILALTNDVFTSNNAAESFQETDLLAPVGTEDSLYVFEGYLVYQLAESNVSAQEFDNIERAKLIRQVDIKNGVNLVYNYSALIDPITGDAIWIPEVAVDGEDQGIRNTFRITDDAFADGDSRLVNHKPYYFTVLAYAYNNYQQFSPNDGQGQRKPILLGRGNIKTYTAVPRPIVYQNLNSAYGDGPVVTRVSGVGTGDNFLDITEETYQAILDGTADGRVTYKGGAGPIKVQIYNPLDVIDGSFTLEIDGTFNTSACGLEEGATWKMTNNTTNEVIFSDATLDEANEQLVAEYGISILIAQAEDTGDASQGTNGAIGARIDYANNNGTIWLSGLPEGVNIGGFGAGGLYNYIKTAEGEVDYNLDQDGSLSNIGGQFFNPFFLCDWRNNSDGILDYITPAWLTNGGQGFVRNEDGNSLAALNNVDIIFTSDKSKWSRCVVVEMGTANNISDGFETVGNAQQFDLRKSASVGQDGQPDGDGEGMSWFPGYAVDVESGKRLNIFFGENSIYNESLQDVLVQGATGADMIFNPTSEVVNGAIIQAAGGVTLSSLVSGCQHMIYVTDNEYDECAAMRVDLAKTNIFISKLPAIQMIRWAGIPLLSQGTVLLPISEGLIPNDVTVKLRVSNPYSREELSAYGDPFKCNPEGELPKYEISFNGVGSTPLEEEEYSGVLANVRAVPNPYFAYSAYETSQFNNTVKITNLPDRADVTIYSLEGKFIQQFRRDEKPGVKPGSNPAVNTSQTNPDLEWNLKNYAGIPVASGVYIIHVSAPELGEERTIKWFGVNRKFDPTGL